MRKVLVLNLFGLVFDISGMVMEVDQDNKRKYSQVEMIESNQTKKKKMEVISSEDLSNVQDQDIFNIIEKLKDSEEKKFNETDGKNEKKRVFGKLEELKKEKEKKDAKIEELLRQNKLLKLKVIELVYKLDKVKREKEKKEDRAKEGESSREALLVNSNGLNERSRDLDYERNRGLDHERNRSLNNETIVHQQRNNEGLKVSKTPSYHFQIPQTSLFRPFPVVSYPWNVRPFAPEVGMPFSCEMPGMIPYESSFPQMMVPPVDQNAVIDKSVLVMDTIELKRLPMIIGECPEITRLEVRGVVGGDLEIMKNLAYLIAKLPNLKILDLRDLALYRIPGAVFSLRHLQELNLFENKLIAVSESIGKLKNLIVLNLGNNHIKHLPDSIGKLKNLQRLSLSENKLQKLPESTGLLEELVELNISNNLLKKMPVSTRNLRNLQNLDISGNQFREVPKFALYLKNLRKMDISRNPICIKSSKGQSEEAYE